jgi:hypothetical protein
LFFKFSVYNRYSIYRTAILAVYVKVIDIPEGVRCKIPKFSAILTRIYNHKENIQKVPNHNVDPSAVSIVALKKEKII